MIIRIVKLSISSSHIDDFTNLFKENKNKILNFEGCNHVELLKESGNENLVLSGGAAMNCVFNGLLDKSNLYRNPNY